MDKNTAGLPKRNRQKKVLTSNRTQIHNCSKEEQQVSPVNDGEK